MTIDHIGLCMAYFADDFNISSNTPYSIIAYILRILGRLAFPLFLFITLEGARHTKNFKNYLIRISIFTILISISIIISNYFFIDSGQLLNIFSTLLIILITYFLLIKNKKIYLKFLVIIPFLFLLVSILYNFDLIYFTNKHFENIITSILPDYSFYTLTFLVFYFIFYYFIEYKIKKNLLTEEEINNFKNSNLYLTNLKSIVSISIVITVIICYLLTYIEGFKELEEYVLATYSVISIIFIFLYNGKLGYSNKYLKYGFYVYYPLHIVVIFGIFYILTLI